MAMEVEEAFVVMRIVEVRKHHLYGKSLVLVVLVRGLVLRNGYGGTMY